MTGPPGVKRGPAAGQADRGLAENKPKSSAAANKPGQPERQALLVASPAAIKAAARLGFTAPPVPAAEPKAPAPSTSPSAPSKKQLAWRARRAAAHDKLWPLLSGAFPEVLCLPPVPLAVGIHKQILDLAGDSVDPAELATFLQYWTRRGSYSLALWRGEDRRNLDGSLAGEIARTSHRRRPAAVAGARAGAGVEAGEGGEP